MNRLLQQFLYSGNKMLTSIDGQVTIGAAGAVSSSSGVLVNSVTHVSTGIYKFNLKGNLNAFLSANAMAISPGSGESGVVGIEIANSSPSDLTSNSAPSFSIKCLDAAGALVDPASGSKLCLQIMGRNSSVSV